MCYILVIVESPAKCEKIEKILGSGYKCIASYGHFRSLVSLNDINMKTFKPTFTVIDEKKSNINKMQKAIIGSDDVIIATDDDREGEGIAWHICDYFNLPLNIL